MVSLLGKFSQYPPEQVVQDEEDRTDKMSILSSSNVQHVNPFWLAKG